LVIRPDDVDDVIAALAFARSQGVPLSIRSGGHGVSGRSTNDGGIVIDLGQLHAVEVLDRLHYERGLVREADEGYLPLRGGAVNRLAGLRSRPTAATSDRTAPSRPASTGTAAVMPAPAEAVT
jgi:hypothetical protein